MDKFTKWFEWTKKNKDLTQNGMLLICVLIEKWEYHNHQPFHYSLKWLGGQIKVKKDDTVLEALNNLVELNLITITKQRENGNRGKNYYSINQETLDKLSGESDTSTPTVVKQKPHDKPAPKVTPELFNQKLLEVFDRFKDHLLDNNDFGNTKHKIRDKLETPENIDLFGDLNEFNKNYNNTFKQWYKKQKDLKSQTP